MAAVGRHGILLRVRDVQQHCRRGGVPSNLATRPGPTHAHAHTHTQAPARCKARTSARKQQRLEGTEKHRPTTTAFLQFMTHGGARVILRQNAWEGKRHTGCPKAEDIHSQSNPGQVIKAACKLNALKWFRNNRILSSAPNRWRKRGTLLPLTCCRELLVRKQPHSNSTRAAPVRQPSGFAI